MNVPRILQVLSDLIFTEPDPALPRSTIAVRYLGKDVRSIENPCACYADTPMRDVPFRCSEKK